MEFNYSAIQFYHDHPATTLEVDFVDECVYDEVDSPENYDLLCDIIHDVIMATDDIKDFERNLNAQLKNNANTVLMWYFQWDNEAVAKGIMKYQDLDEDTFPVMSIIECTDDWKSLNFDLSKPGDDYNRVHRILDDALRRTARSGNDFYEEFRESVIKYL